MNASAAFDLYFLYGNVGRGSAQDLLSSAPTKTQLLEATNKLILNGVVPSEAKLACDTVAEHFGVTL